MTTEIAKYEFRMQATGMVANGKPDFEQWLDFGRGLWKLRTSVQWSIGDWLIYGEMVYGEMYAQALVQTRYTYGALANMASVARAFESSRRRENLSWSHHEAVKSLSEDMQDELLDKAERQELGRDDLRELVVEIKSLGESDNNTLSPNVVLIQIAIVKLDGVEFLEWHNDSSSINYDAIAQMVAELRLMIRGTE